MTLRCAVGATVKTGDLESDRSSDKEWRVTECCGVATYEEFGDGLVICPKCGDWSGLVEIEERHED